jgi:hypothetical protein
MAETLTILRLGVPPTLARTLRSTNPIEIHDRDLPGAPSIQWLGGCPTRATRQATAGTDTLKFYEGRASPIMGSCHKYVAFTTIQ